MNTKFKRYFVLKCNPNLYKGFLLKWNSKVSKTLVLQFDPALFTKRDSLLFLTNPAKNALDFVNKLTPNATRQIPLVDYSALKIEFTPKAGAKIGIRLFEHWLKFGTNYTLNLEVTPLLNKINLNRKFPQKSQISKNSTNDVPEIKVHKPYWQKHSDSPRNQFVRLSQIHDLTGVSADAKIKRSYSANQIAMKFWAWKLNMPTLPKVLGGNSKLIPNKITNSLVNWLVTLELYPTYTAAFNAIKVGDVFVNSLPATKLQQVFAGDLVIIKPNSKTVSKISTITGFADFAYVNKAYCYFLVKQWFNPAVFNSTLVNSNISRKTISGKVRDPAVLLR